MYQTTNIGEITPYIQMQPIPNIYGTQNVQYPTALDANQSISMVPQNYAAHNNYEQGMFLTQQQMQCTPFTMSTQAIPDQSHQNKVQQKINYYYDAVNPTTSNQNQIKRNVSLSENEKMEQKIQIMKYFNQMSSKKLNIRSGEEIATAHK
uniref:Uncharacterized protein LOC114334464 n=1 Tax=Diabrotica virgifera virgifera TaxID=50390 RepID=A0A6P7FVD7_DIAVI